MRATTHQQEKTTNNTGKTPKASRKSRKAVKAASAGCAVMLVAAAFIVPTTTLAPGVEAYADSRIASYAVGDIDHFSKVITNNCVEEATVPAVKAATKKAEKETAVPATTAPAAAAKAATAKTASADKAKTTNKATTNTTNQASANTAKAAASTAKTAAKQSAARPAEQAYGSSQVADMVSYADDYDYSYNDSYDYSDSDYGYSDSYDYDSYDDDGYSDYSYSGSYSGSALVDVVNPDYSYTAKHVSLSSYDRAKVERLVMGEAGTMGYNGCAVVAQAIRDAMVRSGTSSIDRIISEYGYYGDTIVAPNSDVKNAVSYIFDQDGIAVQHRVICFYIGYSAWHETQTYLCTIAGVRFFDLNVK